MQPTYGHSSDHLDIDDHRLNRQRWIRTIDPLGMSQTFFIQIRFCNQITKSNLDALVIKATKLSACFRPTITLARITMSQWGMMDLNHRPLFFTSLTTGSIQRSNQAELIPHCVIRKPHAYYINYISHCKLISVQNCYLQ